MKNLSVFIILTIFVFSACRQVEKGGSGLREGFQDPPPESRVHVWWHWISGHISHEGITRDLEAMAEQGIGGATIFNLGLSEGLFANRGPVVDFMSPEWRELVTHAMQEAGRLNLELIIHNCDGWNTAGGPWVKPEGAMKTLTWSRLHASGPASFKEEFPEPGTVRDFYRDVAVIAFPAVTSMEGSMHTIPFELSTNAKVEGLERIADQNVNTHAVFHPPQSGEPVFIDVSFNEPFPASSLAIADDGHNQHETPKRCRLEAMVEDKGYQKIIDFTLEGPMMEVSFPKVSARNLRLTILEPGFTRRGFRIPELEILSKGAVSSFPRIRDFWVKAGYWIRRRDQLPQGHLKEALIIDSEKLLDLSAHLSPDGILEWEVPEGEWEILRIGYTLTGKTNTPATEAGVGLECDKLDAGYVEDFFNGMPRTLAEDNAVFIGKTFTHYLTDSWEAYAQNWTDRLPEEFLERCGYDILPWLPVLCGEVVGSMEISERFLFDFRQTIAELIKENFYEKMTMLCNEVGLKYQAEASGAQQLFFDPISYPSVIDEVMTEFWISADEEFPPIRLNGDVKGTVSAAHIYDKKIVASESFTSRCNWKQTPYNLKRSGDAALALGLNKLTFHDFTHQPDESVPGWQMIPWGIAVNRKMTWWEQSHAWLAYLSRCQFMLRQGNFVTDALAFHGEGVPVSMYYAFEEDSVRWSQQADDKQIMMDALMGITPFGYAWDGCDDKTIMDRLMVKNGRLVLPHGLSYSLLILPQRETMTPELLRSLKALIEDGAIVYGPRPLRSPSLKNYPECDLEVEQLATEIWGDIDGNRIKENSLGKGKVYWGLSVGEVFEKMGTLPDFEVVSPLEEKDLMYAHRRKGDTDIYFISNQAGRKKRLKCLFRIEGKRPELWYPDNGKMIPTARYELEGERIKLPLEIDPYGSVFVVFDKPVQESITRIESSGEETSFAGEVRYDSAGMVFTAGQEGRYILHTSSGRVHDVDIEKLPGPISIKGPWEVSFPKGWGAPTKTVFDELISWTNHPREGIRYFSGTASYIRQLEIPAEMLQKDRQIILDLGVIRELATVQINGKELGVLWKEPFSMDITKELVPGLNDLEVRVTNVWANRLIGDEQRPQEKRFTDPITRMHYDQPSEQVLTPSGLIGPVTLRTLQKSSIILE